MPYPAVAELVSPSFRDGYFLLRLPRVQKVPCPAGGHFRLEYEIRLERGATMQERTGERFKPALSPEAVRDQWGRLGSETQHSQTRPRRSISPEPFFFTSVFLC